MCNWIYFTSGLEEGGGEAFFGGGLTYLHQLRSHYLTCSDMAMIREHVVHYHDGKEGGRKMGVAPTFLRGCEKKGRREACRATWRRSAELHTIVM